MQSCDVAIIGAGPFGLSAASHLQKIKGLDLRVFGRPMSFWQCHMPPKMLLRSRWDATHIADPGNRLSLDGYRNFNGNHALKDPLCVTDFIKYGNWFHQQAKIQADRRNVTNIDKENDRFQVTLEDGERFQAGRVVVATGIQYFARRPQEFQTLPQCLVSHSSELRDYERFREKDVIVVGAGQSALEAAAFLHEAGANVQMLIRKGITQWRKPRFKWLGKGEWMRIFYGRGDVGPAGASLIIQYPHLFRQFPRKYQLEWDRRAIQPAFSYRHVPPMNGTQIHTSRFAVEAREERERVRLRLNDGSDCLVDHVVIATGYQVDVRRYPFLSPKLLQHLDVVDGFPRVDHGFESSVPGLHFAGATAARSFGPLVRFVAGTPFVSKGLKRRIEHAKRA
jgi:FAD-dependent urate hydroxylase